MWQDCYGQGCRLNLYNKYVGRVGMVFLQLMERYEQSRWQWQVFWRLVQFWVFLLLYQSVGVWKWQRRMFLFEMCLIFLFSWCLDFFFFSLEIWKLQFCQLLFYLLYLNFWLVFYLNLLVQGVFYWLFFQFFLFQFLFFFQVEVGMVILQVFFNFCLY